jgi:hypothetical protein
MPERLADVADGAARPVGDQRRGQRRALAAVAFVEVLDDLFAALVLEVDVDVRRLVALAGDEALEQQMHARRIHLGDVQAVADRGVGRGAAALAEDPAAARELHDVVHGEEEELVAEFADQGELPLDQRPDAVGHAVRASARRPRPGELAQVVGRGPSAAAPAHAGIRSAARRVRTGSSSAIGRIPRAVPGGYRASERRRADADAARRSGTRGCRAPRPRVRWRIAVSRSCSGWRSRTCMCTSLPPPAADPGASRASGLSRCGPDRRLRGTARARSTAAGNSSAAVPLFHQRADVERPGYPQHQAVATAPAEVREPRASYYPWAPAAGNA